jgi:Fe-S-cluster-containing hydrogenase component 2
MYQMYRIDEAICTGCGACMDVCPVEAIQLVDGRARIDDALCIDCGSCARACPQGAITALEAAAPAYPLIRPQVRPALIPATPMALSAPGVTSLAGRAAMEVLPAAARRGRFWPLAGSALIWAARELLPEVLAAWRTYHGEAVQPASPRSAALRQAALHRPRGGHQHRWGRLG